MNLLLILTLLPAAPLTPASPMTWKQAEALAEQWHWGNWYGGLPTARGAAWREGETYYVGYAEGVSEVDGELVEIQVTYPNIAAEYVSFYYSARYRTSTGLFYLKATWLGQGKSWEEAFYDACRHGHRPMMGHRPNGVVDGKETDHFTDKYGFARLAGADGP